MSRWREDPHTLVGAYTLDALADADRSRFEKHMSGCGECRQEADSLREAAARLALAAAVPPPAALRGAVLAAASQTRQTAGAGAPAGHARRAPRQAMTPLLAPRLATAVAGIAILIALGLGALTLSARHRDAQDQARGAVIAAVLTAPDATMMAVHGQGGGMARVVMSHQRRALILTTADLPALPGGDRYEVWVMGPGRTRSAGMLPAARQGMTSPVVVTGLRAGDRIGVTMEPASGAQRPTSPPVLMMNLPS